MAFEWPGYDPPGYGDTRSLLAFMGDDLAGLHGARICNVYSAWDIQAERWCASSPVVFELEDFRLEIGFAGGLRIRLTIDEIQMSASIAGGWFAAAGVRRLPFEWRTDRSELAPYVGRFILGADFLEKNDGGQGILGICIRTDGGTLELVNVASAGGVAVGINPPGYDTAAIKRIIAI
ncbi:hypothetical protein SAMN05216312_108124 [Cohnella sp. OV330]|uniref:hypothetical protein n=1 Tax=Cohnella sp. OV330 TaxID=1855288 RepID=UPI0008E4FBA6|nr:hypothetical protein [Cohnella sp. OV330]SFB44226.1 hypothetical protein SAMN05216312_108124 [Cohnella sp. OV330]